MTREEEIKKEAKNKYPYIKGLPQTLAHQEIFIEGAKWADKTMLEKACKYLKSLTYQEFAGGPLERTFSDEDIEDFRKAIEE